MLIPNRTDVFAICVAACVWAATSLAFAQSMSPADQGYMASMAAMRANTPKGMTGDPDVDFARMMLPHHQAAIDMAKVHLQYGKDSTLRKMSEEIIEGQQKEVGELQDWLKQHGK
jgi:uncharacterized protein (DUF305 family)